MKKWVDKWLAPTVILAIFFFLLPWQTRYIFGLSDLSGSFTQYGILSVYATQVFLVFGLLKAYIFQGSPKFDRRYHYSMLLGSVFLLVAMISSFFAQQSIPALAGFIDLTVAGIAFGALLDKRVNLRVVISAFAIGLLIPAGLGVAQVLFGGSGASNLLGLAFRDATSLGDSVIQLTDGTRILRAYGSFPHPNIFGGYLAVGVLSAFALSFGKNRQAWLAIAVVLAIGLVLTASRSALLGFALGGGLTMLVARLKDADFSRKLVMPIAIVVVALALGVTLFAPSLAASLRGGGDLEQRSLSERAEQYHDWPNAMQGLDWVIGSGPRSYVYTMATIHPDRGVWEYQPIHSVPLLLIAEIGLLGLIVMIVWIVTLDRQNFARFPNRDAAYAHGMGKVIFVIIFFDHYLWSSWAGLVLVAFVAALMLRSGEGSTKA